MNRMITGKTYFCFIPSASFIPRLTPHNVKETLGNIKKAQTETIMYSNRSIKGNCIILIMLKYAHIALASCFSLKTQELKS